MFCQHLVAYMLQLQKQYISLAFVGTYVEHQTLSGIQALL